MNDQKENILNLSKYKGVPYIKQVKENLYEYHTGDNLYGWCDEKGVKLFREKLKETFKNNFFIIK